ncbi:sulfurtransferase TusA family protein [Thalassobius sp. Cn5-15]|uniref:sulfurtransferase TusA family protein n=1 Tax=Thalassobius sp. Cn5-15 TaxID=2917763 RepID=UPI001EF388C9|nr:sulfurtransferase TusA family protein [Thalassobius sp. Cn5-15]MCG7494262.1 sulfurtransferase TusA family protein [Thalassobius sp. Cn5-15]
MTDRSTQTLDIDALGLLCPLPVLRLRKRIQGLPTGSVVTVLADDPAALIDIPHFCHEAGHSYEGAEELPPETASSEGKAPYRYRLVLG